MHTSAGIYEHLVVSAHVQCHYPEWLWFAAVPDAGGERVGNLHKLRLQRAHLRKIVYWEEPEMWQPT